MNGDVCSPQPGTLVKLTTSVYWYSDRRIDDLTDHPFLLLEFDASSTNRADGMAMDQGNRLGLATLMIEGKPRGVFVSRHSMVSVSKDSAGTADEAATP